MMDPTTAILGGVLVAFVSGAAGKLWGNNNKVKDKLCDERRHACSSLVIEKIDNLTVVVGDLKKEVLKRQTV